MAVCERHLAYRLSPPQDLILRERKRTVNTNEAPDRRTREAIRQLERAVEKIKAQTPVKATQK